MDVVFAVVGIGALYGVLIGGVAWVGVRGRRRRVGSDVLGAFDEIWHPAGYRHRVEVRRHDERVDPAPSPGDPPRLLLRLPDPDSD